VTNRVTLKGTSSILSSTPGSMDVIVRVSMMQKVARTDACAFLHAPVR
jgi:hypothetical protein